LEFSRASQFAEIATNWQIPSATFINPVIFLLAVLRETRLACARAFRYASDLRVAGRESRGNKEFITSFPFGTFLIRELDVQLAKRSALAAVMANV